MVPRDEPQYRLSPPFKLNFHRTFNRVVIFGDTNYGYDANGNRTSVNGVAATYNDDDQLVSLGNTQYAWAPDGSLASNPSGSRVG